MLSYSKHLPLKQRPTRLLVALSIATFTFGSLSACTPSVQVALPNEPININLNVKIQHEILIKIDKQLDNMFSSSSGLF
ncbi:MAG: YnbE family lipoprotein [Thiomicrorhabdus sp.]|nr:YnbE family lipoprotein [Thiomicrorhabdus sp.]